MFVTSTASLFSLLSLSLSKFSLQDLSRTLEKEKDRNFGGSNGGVLREFSSECFSTVWVLILLHSLAVKFRSLLKNVGTFLQDEVWGFNNTMEDDDVDDLWGPPLGTFCFLLSYGVLLFVCSLVTFLFVFGFSGERRYLW